jgi:EpsI family protein
MPIPQRDWVPALVLAAGILLVQSSATQQALPLRRPLADVVPAVIDGYQGSELDIPENEAAVAGMTTYLSRAYRSDSAPIPFFTLYVGYYDSQTQGHTIHSPRNCLPGAGWEALQFETQRVETAAGPLRVARYLVQRGEQRALVLYWYQGRGRVESGEYAVKYQLLRDAALRGRTEEALIRVMVPIEGAAAPSLELAGAVTRVVVPALFESLPES